MSLNKTNRLQPQTLIALFIGGLFLFSAIRKILHPEEFALAVYRFHLLPDSLVNLTALYLCWLELLCGLCLWLPRLREAALRLAWGLLLLFSLAVGINLLRGNPFSCGCFGSSALGSPLSWLTLLRNLVLLALLSFAIKNQPKEKKSVLYTLHG